MRIGTNPEKERSKILKYKCHRVIIPVYIPDDEADYFKNLDGVFYANINSLLKTVDLEKTNVTIINNNSKKEVTDFIDDLLSKNFIDKHIKLSQNYGKVYTILQEARASYEDFITIADADVFFYNHWQLETHKVFRKFKNAGVVGLTPDPNMAFYCNNSVFSSNIFRIKKGKIVNDFDLELFENSVGNLNLFVTQTRNWKKEQYYLQKDDVKVVVGANHFASTYRRKIFENLPFQRPVNVFPGGELSFLDIPIDKLGYFRVSLPKAFAYHMGNNIDHNVNLENLQNDKLTENEDYKADVPLNIIPYKLKHYFVRIIRKYSII